MIIKRLNLGEECSTHSYLQLTKGILLENCLTLILQGNSILQYTYWFYKSTSNFWWQIKKSGDGCLLIVNFEGT
jgi:hypothetical protein